MRGNNGSCFNIRPSEYTLPVKLKKTYSVRQSHSSEARSCSSRKGIRPVLWTPNAHFRANNNPILSASHQFSYQHCILNRDGARQSVKALAGTIFRTVLHSSTQFCTVLHSSAQPSLRKPCQRQLSRNFSGQNCD